MASTTIDHAIAIPTRPSNVWDQVSNLENNSVWQADCEAVRILTTNKNGRGTRWRNTSPSGTEIVLEITAWYEGLGYEYTIVDGVSFTSNRGRVRLQDAPEGTVVQWTFTYEIGGMFSGLRNALGTKRTVEADIINSLKNLYNYMKHLRGEEQYDVTSSKAYLREAPDVEERSSYQPRHPSKSATDALDAPVTESIPEADMRFMPPEEKQEITIPEPEITKEDTRPNPTTSEMPVVTVEDETEKTDDFVFTPSTDDDTISSRDYVYKAPEPSRNMFLDDVPPIESSGTKLPPSFDEGDIDILDTGQISVFELFGLQKPSETQQMRAIQDDNTGNSLPLRLDTSDDDTSKRRMGLRAKMRIKHVKVRLPQSK